MYCDSCRFEREDASLSVGPPVRYSSDRLCTPPAFVGTSREKKERKKRNRKYLVRVDSSNRDTVCRFTLFCAELREVALVTTSKISRCANETPRSRRLRRKMKSFRIDRDPRSHFPAINNETFSRGLEPKYESFWRS